MNRHEKQEVEQGLRNLLEEMMIFCNEKINGIENWSCQDLIQRISKLSRQLRNSNLDYKKLESVLQQQEADIRNHISLQSQFIINLTVEQQMKLYQDGLQSKLEEANQEIKRLQEGLSRLKKSKYEQSMIVVNQNQRKRIRVMMGLPLRGKFLQRSYPPSLNMEVTPLIEAHVMNSLRDTISYCNNSRPLIINDQIQLSFIIILQFNLIYCNIQISQYMMKGRQTLAEICNIQQNRSQTKHNNSVNKSGYNNSINSETIRNLLKMK